MSISTASATSWMRSGNLSCWSDRVWSASTARYGTESPGWCARPYLSQRTWPIKSGPSNTLSATITAPEMQHYQDSTTVESGVVLALEMVQSLTDHSHSPIADYRGHVCIHLCCLGSSSTVRT